MKTKNLLIWILIIVILLGGGVLIYKFSSSKSETLPADLPNPNGKLSQAELEKYLLEKRLDLQKYFVFNLGEEVKLKKYKIDSTFLSNIREVVPSLSTHLTRLIGEPKEFIFFQGQYSNEPSPDWDSDSLDQKINSGKEWFIIFDKTKINEETCNYFSQTGGARGWTFPKVCVLAVENKDNVWIKKTKQEALEIIKEDPALIGKI